MSRKKSSERPVAMTAASRSTGSRRKATPVFSNTCRMACGLLLAWPALTACIVPIPAEPTEDPDGGTGKNAYPVIKDATPAMPGLLTLNPSNPQQVTLTLSDSDIADSPLNVRIFIDYPKPGFFPFAVRNDLQNGKEDRPPLTTDTTGWCDNITPNVTHVVDVVVADRDFDDSPNTPLPLKTPKPPGKTSTRSWLIQCKTP